MHNKITWVLFVITDSCPGKWVTLYKSVFIALNEHGQVVKWQFTKTTSLDEVKSQLQRLQDGMTPVLLATPQNHFCG